MQRGLDLLLAVPPPLAEEHRSATPPPASEAGLLVRSFFKRIAIAFDIAGSDAILDKQIDDVLSRVQKGKLRANVEVPAAIGAALRENAGGFMTGDHAALVDEMASTRAIRQCV